MRAIRNTCQAKEPLFDFGPKSANFKYDKRMIMAAQIAAERAHKHSTSRCWMYVKNASFRESGFQPSDHRIRKQPAMNCSTNMVSEARDPDPFAAPLGSVLVYGGRELAC